MNIRYYDVTKGEALKIIRDFHESLHAADEARKKICRKYKSKEIVSCEGEMFGLVSNPDETLWRWHKKLGAYVPRRDSKEGKALAKELYNDETYITPGRILGDRLGMQVFINFSLCSPGAIRISARRYLLTSLDTEWAPPEGVKRISDIEYEQIRARNKKRKA
jgi:hypothetical protein